MKKSLILLVVLLVVGALAFAEDVKPTWTVSGSAAAIIGYDLNVNAGGITNDQSFTFDFAFFPTQTFSKGGEKLYGMIQVADVHFGIINGLWDAVDPTPSSEDADYYSAFADSIKNSSGTITAKVVYEPFYVLVSKGLDDMRFNYAANAEGYSDINFYTLSNLFPTAGTVALGYSSKMISARFTVLSVGDYATIPALAQVQSVDPKVWFTPAINAAASETVRVANTAGDFAFGLWVTANPIDMIAVDLKAILDTYQKWAGFGGKLTVTPIKMISLSVGADAYSNLGSVFEMDLKPALTVNLGDDTLTASLYYNTYDAPVATDSEMDVSVKFVEADGDKGYVPGLGASVELGLANLAPVAPAKMSWSVDVLANYVIGAWKPYAEFKMSANTLNTDQMVKVNAGVVFTGIANTAITLDYLVTDLTSVEPGPLWGGLNDKGVIALTTKISY
jgi:hypothetical protein